MDKNYINWLEYQISSTSGNEREAYKKALVKYTYYDNASILYNRLVNSHVKSWYRKSDTHCNGSPPLYFIVTENIDGKWITSVDIHENKVTYIGMGMSERKTISMDQFIDIFQPYDYF
jgi:hypothetical protein